LTLTEKVNADLRRSELLDAAAFIFATKGYHAASMRELAKLLNIKAGSLYYHIASKEQLLNEVCEIGMAELILNVDRAADAHGNFTDRLKAIITGHARVVETYGEYLRCYQTENIHLPQPMRDAMRLQLVRFHRKLDDIFKDAAAKGEIRSDVRIKTARFAVISVLYQLSRVQADQHPSDLQETAEEFTGIVLSGLTQR
jgi:AcrR family transcriptional regulator